MHFAGYQLGTTPQMHLTYLMWKRGWVPGRGARRLHAAGPSLRSGSGSDACTSTPTLSGSSPTHDSDAEARAAEISLSLRYSLPMLPFYRRKSASGNSLVGNQKLLEQRLLRGRHAKRGATRFDDQALSIQHPHSHRQRSDGQRQSLRVTLCAERGRQAMHRSPSPGATPRASRARGAWAQDPRGEDRVGRLGATRPFKDYGQAVRIAGDISLVLDVRRQLSAVVSERSRAAVISGSSLAHHPCGSVRPGMTIFTENGLRRSQVGQAVALEHAVYDLNVEGTHNFVAEGSSPPLDLRLPPRRHPQHPRLRARLPRGRDRSSSSRTTAPPRRSSRPPTRSSSATANGGRSGSGPKSPAASRCSSPSSRDEHEEARWVAGEIQRLAEEEGSGARTSPSSTGPTR